MHFMMETLCWCFNVTLTRALKQSLLCYAAIQPYCYYNNIGNIEMCLVAGWLTVSCEQNWSIDWLECQKRHSLCNIIEVPNSLVHFVYCVKNYILLYVYSIVSPGFIRHLLYPEFEEWSLASLAGDGRSNFTLPHCKWGVLGGWMWRQFAGRCGRENWAILQPAARLSKSSAAEEEIWRD